MKLIESYLFIFIVMLVGSACHNDKVETIHNIEDSLYISGSINGKLYERTGENYNRNALFYKGGDSLVFKAYGAEYENFFDFQRLEIFLANSFDISLIKGFDGYYAPIEVSNDFLIPQTFYNLFYPREVQYLHKSFEQNYSNKAPFNHPGEGVFILLTEKSKEKWYSYNKVDNHYFTANNNFVITDLEILNSDTPSAVYRLDHSRYIKVQGEFSCWLYNHEGDSIYIDKMKFESVFHD